MKPVYKAALVVVVLSLVIAACSTVPITGRKQLSLIPASEMMSTSYQQYGDFLKANKVSTNQQQITMVRTVGTKIQHAVETYMQQNGYGDALKDYKWEFNVVESNEVNAHPAGDEERDRPCRGHGA